MDMRPDAEDCGSFWRAFLVSVSWIASGNVGKIIGRVVVDEKNLVIISGQHFGHAIQADGSTLMEIVAIVIIPAVKNDRDHESPPLAGATALLENLLPMPRAGILAIRTCSTDKAFSKRGMRHGSRDAVLMLRHRVALCSRHVSALGGEPDPLDLRRRHHVHTYDDHIAGGSIAIQQTPRIDNDEPTLRPSHSDDAVLEHPPRCGDYGKPGFFQCRYRRFRIMTLSPRITSAAAMANGSYTLTTYTSALSCAASATPWLLFDHGGVRLIG